jgi:class 3 adenylate cyclase
MVPQQRFVLIHVTHTFMTPVAPDGQPLGVLGTVRHRCNDILMVESQITDTAGQTVAVSQGSCLLVDRDARARPRAVERTLLTVMFTDIVGSTERASALGDAEWRHLLDEHHVVVRRHLEFYNGREIKTTGDGFLTVFHSPSRAIECARAIRSGLARLGIEIRAGIHSGECEVAGGDVTGVAVHIASRVQEEAHSGEILLTGTVRDLISGAGIGLVDRGTHELKWLDGQWSLLAVTTD